MQKIIDIKPEMMGEMLVYFVYQDRDVIASFFNEDHAEGFVKWLKRNLKHKPKCTSNWQLNTTQVTGV